MRRSRLGVVMPAHNEETWIERSIRALHVAAERAGWALDLVVVDDGSTDSTPTVVDRLAREHPMRVIHQVNTGRFGARRTGLEALSTPFVLLLDARVILDPDALVAVADDAHAHPEAAAWNGHVEVDTEGNPFAAFWSGLTKLGWRRYFARPRRVVVREDTFNSYPKGTGIFLVDRSLLAAQVERFDPLVTRLDLASDDTRLLRGIAAGPGIVILPGFSCRYHGRATAQGWARQVFYRGTTFVDGYLPQPRWALPALGAGLAAAAAAGALAVLAPWWLLALTAVGVAGTAVGVLLSGGTAWEAASVTMLAVPFGLVFSAGLARGLILVPRS